MYKQINGQKIKLTEEEVNAETIKTANWNSKKTERQLEIIRAQRKPLLEIADKEINKLFDAGKDATKWSEYRQLLRDVTTSNSDVYKIEFPKSPS